MATSLIKPGLRTALAEALYQEILTNSNNYYYFLGSTLPWGTVDTPPVPQNTSAYEKNVRQEMIFLKKITAADVAFTIDRYDWANGEVYDKYDDRVGDTVQVFNCYGTRDVEKGISYIMSNDGEVFDPKQIAVGYTAIGLGIAAGAKVVSVLPDRVAVSIDHIGVVSGDVAFTNITPSGATSIENAKMYCITTDNRIYKCLDNNGGAPSTAKPYSTSLTPITTSDGYVWKYMYTVPAALINKFMTDTDIPVTTAIRDQFYTRGSLSAIAVDNYGTGYQIGDKLTVVGDGYQKQNKYKILSPILENVGSGYTTTPSVTVDDPFISTDWEENTSYLLGEYVKTSQNKIYEVVSPGTTDSVYPTHTGDEPVICGTVSFKFVGLTPSISVSMDGDHIDGISFDGSIVGYVNVTVPGYGYSSSPTVTISATSGGGATAMAQIVSTRVSNIVVTNRGFNYGASSVIAAIEPPIPTNQCTLWSSSGVSVSVDAILRVEDSRSTRYYKVISAGTVGSPSTSTSTSQDFTSGTATLRFVAQNAEADVELYHGFGYDEIPNASVNYPIEYSVSPLVTPWVAGTEVSDGDIVEYQGRFYSVAVDQTNTPLNSKTPLHASGTEVEFGPAEHDISLTFIANAAVISLSAIKTQALLAPIIENGQITSAIIVDPGVGYTNAVIAVESFAGGYGAQVRPITSFGDLESRQANVELLAIPGTVDSIEIINPGGGYTSSPQITIEGDGTGATATAIVSTQGSISRIVITNSGTGYTFANIIIGEPNSVDPTSHYQAHARSIVSPTTGHGRNAVNELYATNLTLSTNISTEKNQGITVNNDYRQVGVIKNPHQYNTQLRFNDTTGSSCFAVTGIFESPELDMTLYDEDFDPDGSPNGNRYRIVAISTNDNLSTLVVQSLDNAVMETNQSLYYKTGISTKRTTIISKVTLPAVDKYSGEIMFIDNRNAFLPKSNQIISFKTVIKL